MYMKNNKKIVNPPNVGRLCNKKEGKGRLAM